MGPLFVIPRMSAAAWDALNRLGWHAALGLGYFLHCSLLRGNLLVYFPRGRDN